MAKFVEAKAHASAHPVFGNVSGDAKTNSKDSKGLKNRKGTNLATWVGAGSQEGDASLSANASTNTAGAMRVPLSVLGVRISTSWLAAEILKGFQ